AGLEPRETLTSHPPGPLTSEVLNAPAK
ncbi:MAG: hypothetical protein QOI21_6280, partial [Actinomycetota bacterium]|nr:hypothetical protein [Actinomycetota bacterium]